MQKKSHTNTLQPTKRSFLPGILLGTTSIAVSVLFHYYPQLCEQLYSRTFFIAFRHLIGIFSRLLPFPIVYLEAVLLIIFFFFSIKKWLKTKGWKSRCARLLLGILSFIGWAIFLFQFSWGFNYQRIPVERHLKLHLKGLELKELETAYQYTLDSALYYRKQIDDFHFNEKKHLPEIHKALTQTLRNSQYAAPEWVFVKPLFDGSLLHFETAGIYIPFAGEGYYDSGLHDLSKPFTACHELSHAYGFGDEGLCNFWAYVANSSSKEPLIRYCTELRYLRYLYSAIRRINPKAYNRLIKAMPDNVRNDIIAIIKKHNGYASFFPKFRDQVYNSYLKTQGVKEGIKSYSRIVVLVEAWKRKQKN